MLPDYPKTKNRYRRFLMRQYKERLAAYMIPLSEIPKSRVFEGDKLYIVREDGKEERSGPKKIEVAMELKFREIETMKPDVIIGKVDSAAKEMAVEISKMSYERIKKGCEEVGNIMDFKGKKFGKEAFLRMFEMIQIDFDEKGNPYMPTIVAGPEAYKMIEEILPKMESDPNFKRELSNIMEKKKREWYDRESNRKLVG
jgi:hypothetical protein